MLIAKKAHTIATLSALHDRIMTRYYKFLVVNVLVFFCVGTAAVQSFLVSFSATSGLEVIQVVADESVQYHRVEHRVAGGDGAYGGEQGGFWGVLEQEPAGAGP